MGERLEIVTHNGVDLISISLTRLSGRIEEKKSVKRVGLKLNLIVDVICDQSSEMR